MLLSADKSSPLYISDKALREKFGYSSEGVLYRLRGMSTDPDMMNYMKRIHASEGKYPVVKDVDLTTLINLYGQDDDDEDASKTQAEVIRLVKDAVEKDASDIHIVVKEKVTTIEFRVDGDLMVVRDSITVSKGFSLCGTIYSSMCDVADTNFKPHLSQDGRMKSSYLKSCNLFGARIATRPTADGILMVIRLLYDHQEGHAPSITDLGYLDEQKEGLDILARTPVGIAILSGPTGSGKSTTLSTMMNMIYKMHEGRKHILTIEDPPEYRIPGARQTAIICDRFDDVAISKEWARSISNAMRLDPDVIMIGEMRDEASATGGMRAAMTGHQVWSTLHTNDAMGILQRLVDIGVNISLLTDAKILTGLVNQSLVKKLCSCKIPFLGNEERITDVKQRDRIHRFLNVERVFIKGEGCEHCGGRGFKGRTVVAEVILTNQPMLDAFRMGGKSAAIEYWLSHGGLTKCSVMQRKINMGLIDPVMAEDSVCLLDSDEHHGLAKNHVAPMLHQVAGAN